MTPQFSCPPSPASNCRLGPSGTALVRAQYERLRPEERRQFRRVLRAAARLDRQLGELHLVLPVLEVRFLGLARSEELTLQPSELLEELKYWD